MIERGPGDGRLLLKLENQRDLVTIRKLHTLEAIAPDFVG
jgi:hypothetical protein